MTVSISDHAPLNDVVYEAWSEVNALGMVVVLDGLRYSVISARWTENAHGAGDTLSVTVPLSTNPDFPIQLFRGQPSVQFFSPTGVSLVVPSGTPGAITPALTPAETAASNADVVVELWVGFPQNPTVDATSIDQLQRRFLGEVDLYSGVFHDDTVTFSCRSLAAHLIDDHVTGVSMNQTVGDFLTKQATRLGLPTPVITSLPGMQPATIQEVLRYDQIGGASFAASLYGLHPMDLAIRGAQVDDADAWVDIRTGVIHYEPPSLVDRGDPIVLKWGRDWIGLSGSHAPQFSKNIEVVVHAYNPRTSVKTTVRVVDNGDGSVTTTQSQSTVTSSAVLGTNQTVRTGITTNANGTRTTSISSGTSSGGAFTTRAGQGAAESAKQRYPLYVGAVSPQRAVQMAQAYRRQISQHEFSIEGEIPITNRLQADLSITSLLRITGAPWSLINDTYYPRAIEYTCSLEDGWKARVLALNHRLANASV